MKEQIREQLMEWIPILIAIGIMWWAVNSRRKKAERELDQRVEDILRGTIRNDERHVQFTTHWLTTQLAEFSKKEVRRLLRAMVKRNVLQRIPYAKQRHYRDRYVLTPEAVTTLRTSQKP